jgi:hypothetical protein
MSFTLKGHLVCDRNNKNVDTDNIQLTLNVPALKPVPIINIFLSYLTRSLN